jgi:hypothetical protein
VNSLRLKPKALVLLALVASSLGSAWAQSTTSNYIFQCVTAHGRKLTSDRLIAECNDREQKVFNQSGVLLRTVSPSLTAEERAVVQAKLDKERVILDAKAEDLRRDRQLIARFATEGSHYRARENALESSTSATRIAERRLEVLAEERKPLDLEAEFYLGKSLPPKLKFQFDALDATEQALRSALRTQADERTRVNDMYDIELERLKKLWAGAMPGSLGPLRAPTAVATEAVRPQPETPSATEPATRTGGGGGGGSGTPSPEAPSMTRQMTARVVSKQDAMVEVTNKPSR